MKTVFCILFPFILFGQTDTVYLRVNGDWIKMSRSLYNSIHNIVPAAPAQLPQPAQSAMIPWGEILANGFGFAKNVTDPKDYTPKDAFAIAKQLPAQFRRVNRMYKRGRLKSNQYNRTSFMLDRITNSIAVPLPPKQ